MSKTDRERLEIRSQFAHELASNGFPNVSVLSKEHISTIAHPYRLKMLSILEDREHTIDELSDILNASNSCVTHHAQELATICGVNIFEGPEDTVVHLTADYIVLEPLTVVPDVDIPEAPDEPEVPVVGDTNE